MRFQWLQTLQIQKLQRRLIPSFAALALLAAAPAEAQTNLLVDPGYEPGTILHPFFRTSSNPWLPGEWNAEDADLISSVTVGVTPIGSQMLRINATGGTHSQVTQIVDVGDELPRDCCLALATWSILVNAAEPTTLTVSLEAGTGQTSVGTLAGLTSESVSITTDGDPGTWERLEGTRLVPRNTEFLNFHISSLNAQIPADGVFVDESSVVIEPNLVTDGGFEPVTLLHPFSRTSANPYVPGEWNAEDADVVGVDSLTGIQPKNGTRMLRVNPTGGTHSQVNQILGAGGSVSPLGDSIGTWSVCVNAPVPTTVNLHMSAGDGQTSVGTLTNPTTVTVSLLTDADPNTWEMLKGARFLPASTTLLELQISALNSQIPGEGFFVDCASVQRTDNQLVDPGFEPGTTLHAFFRNPGNPYTPGEWNAEDADVLSAPTSGVTPLSGSGMLRINATGGDASQVNQIIALSPNAFGDGDTMAIFGVYVNTTAATTVTLHMGAGDGQTSVGTLTNPTTDTVSLLTDADPGTWELIEGSLMLPVGTAFLELQVSAPNSEISADGVFVDLGRVSLVRCVLRLFGTLPGLGGPAVGLLVLLLGAGGAKVLHRRGGEAGREESR